VNFILERETGNKYAQEKLFICFHNVVFLTLTKEVEVSKSCKTHRRSSVCTTTQYKILKCEAYADL